MSIIAQLCLWLFIDTVFGFLFYATGCLLLKILTLGRYEMALKDFASFKSGKSIQVMSIIAIGASVYIAIIAFIVYVTS